MNPISGILLMAIGSAGAASFYVPIKKVKEWSWESYWLVQGIASWIIAPWILAGLTVPGLMSILGQVSVESKLWTIFFGALWGVGGLTFGLSMRYLGVALGQSIALGFCAAVGTLLPAFLQSEGSNMTLITLGVAICLVGIAIIGYAGALKNKNISEEEKKKSMKEFALKKGLLIAILAGVMSACFNFGLNGVGTIKAGKEFQEIALANGVNSLYVTNPALIFVLIGGAIFNFTYSLILNFRNKTYKDYFGVKAKTGFNNLAFCFLGGFLWPLQFFFFGIGQSMLPPSMVTFGWSILMALNILFANIWGIILNEWKGAGHKTLLVLLSGIVILILSTFVVNF